MGWINVYKTYILDNWQMLLVLFICMFVLGLFISFLTIYINQEGYKKHFRGSNMNRFEKSLDEKLMEEYREGLGDSASMYLKDEQEHHANKKFKS